MRQIALLIGAAMACSGCMTMEVDASTMQTLQDGLMQVRIVEKTRRDPMMLGDDMNDEYSLWAVNDTSIPTCLGVMSNGYVQEAWLVAAGQETQLWNGRRVASGTWGTWNATYDPQCTRQR